jgi:geranylgeranyl diphosphate synthase type I
VPEVQSSDLEKLISQTLAEMRLAVSHLEGTDPLLDQMARWHLGWGNGIHDDPRNRGKLVRPTVALSAALAVGGAGRAILATPLAAAIELLHNFTLVHDDIQDQSQVRRFRPTVWAKWGQAQAINAGDALFAAAHLALLRSVEIGVDPAIVVDLIRGFDATTLEIVSGQVQDLQFESRRDVRADEYVEMITGKTARIVEFAAGSGAWVAGADQETSAHFAAFGLAMGLGFQIQDDALGIFGLESETGKPAGDDLRRKKQSLPVLMLQERGPLETVRRLDQAYAADLVLESDVTALIGQMRALAIDAEMRDRVNAYHEAADNELAATGLPAERLAPLRDLLANLEDRTI